MNLNLNRCAKLTTVAIIENKGKYWIGINSCNNPQELCPRGNMPSGVGYALCKSICQQTGHAEENAVKAAGKDANGGKLYLFGHTYICSNCENLIKEAGIKSSYILGNNN